MLGMGLCVCEREIEGERNTERFLHNIYIRRRHSLNIIHQMEKQCVAKWRSDGTGNGLGVKGVLLGGELNDSNANAVCIQKGGGNGKLAPLKQQQHQQHIFVHTPWKIWWSYITLFATIHRFRVHNQTNDCHYNNITHRKMCTPSAEHTHTHHTHWPFIFMKLCVCIAYIVRTYSHHRHSALILY